MPPTLAFPARTKYIPVPAQALGPLLAEIDSLAELKCTLRLIGMVHQRRSKRLWVTTSELENDSILADALAQEPEGSKQAIIKGVQLAITRGTLLEAEQNNEKVLFLNDEPGRKAMAQLGEVIVEEPAPPSQCDDRPNIFVLYEQNIGSLTPLLTEELKEAESVYPWPWIEEAFRIAVSLNHRSWRYIARILERWATEGKDDGEPRRHSQKIDRKEYLRRYGYLAR